MANTSGEKELKTDWPIEEGFDLGTTKIDGRDPSLKAEGLNGVRSTIRDGKQALL